jgi:hypothetical protein
VSGFRTQPPRVRPRGDGSGSGFAIWSPAKLSEPTRTPGDDRRCADRCASKEQRPEFAQAVVNARLAVLKAKPLDQLTDATARELWVSAPQLMNLPGGIELDRLAGQRTRGGSGERSATRTVFRATRVRVALCSIETPSTKAFA